MKATKNFKYSPDGITVLKVVEGDELDQCGIAAAERLGIISEEDIKDKSKRK